MGAPVLQHRADRFLHIDERFLFSVALGHDFRQSRNQHGEPAAGLRLQDDGKAVAHGHLQIENVSRRQE